MRPDEELVLPGGEPGQVEEEVALDPAREVAPVELDGRVPADAPERDAERPRREGGREVEDAPREHVLLRGVEAEGRRGGAELPGLPVAGRARRLPASEPERGALLRPAGAASPPRRRRARTWIVLMGASYGLDEPAWRR